jgi:two-component system response regulator YesN
MRGEKQMYRMLVADDESIERRVLIKRLKVLSEGQLELYEAENGREVLKLYEEKKIQILLLDIEMPGVTGLEAAEQIRSRDQNCCIIFLTAFDEFSYARRAISVHALDYLLKPCDEKELLLVTGAAMKYVDDIERGKASVFPVLSNREPGHEADGSAEKTENGEGGTENTSQLRRKILSYIEKNYMHDLSVQEIAEALCYSEAYFCKLFKQEFNQSFVTYLTIYRVDKAKKQLAMPSVNIKEIGKSVGYPDSNYFAKVFRRVAGMSPSDYRTEILEKR